MKKFSFLVVLATILFLSHSAVYAQEPSIQNISTVDVDKLTDAQIQKLMDKVDAGGYTESQMILMAKSRGMSELQIQKLRTRMEKVKNTSTSSRTITSDNRLRKNPSNSAIDQNLDQNSISNDPFSDLVTEKTKKLPEDELAIFGSEFFQNSQLDFRTGLNMPTPDNYIIGAGDEIIIDIWGASEQTYQSSVTPEGAIRIPSLGPIYVTGLTMERAKSKIISHLKKIYSTIGTSSTADVSLGQAKSISVHIIGEVVRPGTYEMSSFSTVFNALYSAGGPSEMGSMRKVEIFRAQKLISTFDAYSFLINGLGENISLQEQDVIIVRSYLNKVRLEGEIKNPAIYELKDGETMEALLNYAGGFTENAYQGVLSLRRIENNFKTIRSISIDNLHTSVIKSGDNIIVSKVSNEFRNRVTIEGPVNNPGEYQLSSNIKLSELLKNADGFRGDIFMDRGVIIRQKPDYSLASLTFDPKKVIAGEEDIELMNNDLIKFQSIYDLREVYNIQIQGEVNKPGKFSYIEGITVEDLIYLAGGFKESAAKSFVEVARRIGREQDDNSNKTAEIFNFSISSNLTLSEADSKFILTPFDIVVIRKSPFFDEQDVVEIEGEAEYPGKYVIESNEERISSVIKRAGGLSESAYAKGATLIRRTEYFRENDSDVDITDAAVRIRKQDLTTVFKKDTLFTNEAQVFRQQESVGINLVKILQNPGSKYDMILKKGDIISIPKQLQTVRVRGEVLYPSNMRYDVKQNFKGFVSQAGGFDQSANKKKAYIIYANGASARTKNFLFVHSFPNVEPGAEIVIPRKSDKEPMPAQMWISLATSLTAMALVISRF